jgi:CDP-glucose 4,6-dehydratase
MKNQLAQSYEGKKVFVTGNTGFKGSWLCAWLLSLGADVAGYSLDVPSKPSNYEVLGLEGHIKQYWGDIRDREKLDQAMEDYKPDVVFHLAAQALVRSSYEEPALTFETNALGTLNVLECLRKRPEIKAAVIITSDKCYRNVEWEWGYRENDRLGGEDPYSGSKGCAELIFYSYYESFFKQMSQGPKIATARAGNVIGGGDWAKDRIIPDCVRSWSENKEVVIRNPMATRPWQHVLEPLSGYLWLGSQLMENKPAVAGASYNLGPDASVDHTVETLLTSFGKSWSAAHWTIDQQSLEQKPEARLLKLACDKALSELQWSAALSFDETVRFTSSWYATFYGQEQKDMFAFTVHQINDYQEQAQSKKIVWSCES